MNHKVQRLQGALAAWQLDAILLTRRDNVAWLTDGAGYFVVERAETGVASLLVTAAGVTLIAPDNELARLLAEEPMPFPCATIAYPWYQTLQQHLPTIGRLGSDTPLPHGRDVQAELVFLRQGLSDDEQRRFRQLGLDAATLVEEIAARVRPGITERQVEGDIAAACLGQGIRPVCTLVAADERIAAFRHPTPGPMALRRTLLITLGAERQGLHVSLTRTVQFGAPDEPTRARRQAIAAIHAEIMTASRAGRRWQAIFADVQAAYTRHNYPEAWRQHHQGGPAGYGCRDFIVTPDTPGALAANTALAWNPTLSGVKSEDTALLTDQGISWLTRSGNWPLMTIEHQGQRWEFADWLSLPSS